VADRWPDGLVFESGPATDAWRDSQGSGRPSSDGSEVGDLSPQALRRAVPDGARLQVRLTGDGVFTRQGTADALGVFRDKGYSCQFLTTSGAALTEERADALVRLRREGRLGHVSVSLDGSVETSAPRGGGGTESLRRTAEGLARLRDAAARARVRLPVSVNTTLAADLLGLVEETVGLAVTSGVDTIGLTHLAFTTPEDADDTLRLIGEADPRVIAMPVAGHPGVTAEQVRGALATARETGRCAHVHVDVRPNVAPSLIDSYYTPGAVLAGRCLYPFLHARVAASGKVHFCPFIRVEVGNLVTSTLEAVWNSPRSVTLRKALLEHGLFPVCRRCCKVELAPTAAPQPIRLLDHPPRPVVGALEPAAPAARMSRT
jgi:MoaA/NifB/PqqE/SkfB family radical SAM enzyme